MTYPIGNEFWKLRKDLSETGKKLTPDQIVVGAQEYIDRCLNEPLIEVDYRGKDADKVELPKMRAMTLEGLFYHLDVSKETWRKWRKDPLYVGILTRVENLMFIYDFEGAAAGLLNSAIIAKKLGIIDKQEITNIMRDTSSMTTEELIARAKATKEIEQSEEGQE